ncbi:hypothetical protein F9L33_14610 [Amylibacter sp. SFDW26]|uniref:hypothetical protein n=1 Tax=Amylibacter sp. SFDW26 TaxID=2652722 RepID=UPI0012621543|nr:hypothetical protein [Amylibacter sp. SFDW26]KAB7610125.1 hypothetical protein F9L33_14610 [Amylibacter sp. SFDW26]
MGNAFKKIQKYFEPQEGWALETPLQFKRQREFHALWIGIIAFTMPALLYYSNRTSECFRDTISHTYYTPFWGDIFVALTAFVGVSLLFYKGQSKAERLLALIAGISAIIVAIVPTTGTGCETTYAASRVFLFSDTDNALKDAFVPGEYYSTIHGVAAGVLFLMLTIFSVFVFTAIDKSNKYQIKSANRNKDIRNIIYRITGSIMLATLILLATNKFFGFPDCDIFDPNIGIGKSHLICEDNDKLFSSRSWDHFNLTFYFEWLALASFGGAWFVKGRGGGFLLLDETPNRTISKPWWWPLRFGGS